MIRYKGALYTKVEADGLGRTSDPKMMLLEKDYGGDLRQLWYNNGQFQLMSYLKFPESIKSSFPELANVQGQPMYPVEVDIDKEAALGLFKAMLGEGANLHPVFEETWKSQQLPPVLKELTEKTAMAASAGKGWVGSLEIERLPTRKEHK
jgi:hypothetical protein